MQRLAQRVARPRDIELGPKYCEQPIATVKARRLRNGEKCQKRNALGMREHGSARSRIGHSDLQRAERTESDQPWPRRKRLHKRPKRGPDNVAGLQGFRAP